MTDPIFTHFIAFERPSAVLAKAAYLFTPEASCRSTAQVMADGYTGKSLRPDIIVCRLNLGVAGSGRGEIIETITASGTRREECVA